MYTFVTVPKAASLLGVTEDSVRDAIQRKAIIGGKIGGRYYIVKESLETYKPREYPRDGEKKEADEQL